MLPFVANHLLAQDPVAYWSPAHIFLIIGLRRLYGENIALISGLMTATALHSTVIFRSATPDPLLILTVTIALLSYLRETAGNEATIKASRGSGPTKTGSISGSADFSKNAQKQADLPSSQIFSHIKS